MLTSVISKTLPTGTQKSKAAVTAPVYCSHSHWLRVTRLNVKTECTVMRRQ
jgi:hypothetical protein